jgi:hypothetical protein
MLKLTPGNSAKWNLLGGKEEREQHATTRNWGTRFSEVQEAGSSEGWRYK